MKQLSIFMGLMMAIAGCTLAQEKQKTKTPQKMEDNKQEKHNFYSRNDTTRLNVDEKEWQKLLSPEVYHIAREKGTERPWTSRFEHLKDKGTYYCAVCGNALFVSDTKFDSGCGWPSFYQAISKSAMIYTPDNSHGMQRTEVQCGRCKSHLGHLFDDGPPPTGLRYCINGVVLDFEKAKAAEKKFEEKKG